MLQFTVVTFGVKLTSYQRGSTNLQNITLNNSYYIIMKKLFYCNYNVSIFIYLDQVIWQDDLSLYN